MTIGHCGRDVPSVNISVLLCPQVLSAVSLEPIIICCARASADFIKVFGQTSQSDIRETVSIQFVTPAD